MAWYSAFGGGSAESIARKMTAAHVKAKSAMTRYHETRSLTELRMAADALCKGLEAFVDADNAWKGLTELCEVPEDAPERAGMRMLRTSLGPLAVLLDSENELVAKLSGAPNPKTMSAFVSDVSTLMVAVSQDRKPHAGQVSTLRGQVTALRDEVCRAATDPSANTARLQGLILKGGVVVLGLGLVALDGFGVVHGYITVDAAQSSGELGFNIAGSVFPRG